MRKNLQSGPFLDRTQPPLGPPGNLKAYGCALWSKVQDEYAITDAGGLEMLGQACAMADLAEQCAAKIAAEGLTVTNGSGAPRDHPLIRHEQAARSFIVKTLKGLGLNVEPLRRAPGRPPAQAPVPAGIIVEDDDVRFDADAH